ncbi:MAG: universal stress protein [Halovenus sp.]|uniref:universal stress protein n=1 Tax=Halovenus amylolytica TaxID=2500550 RepID=UPI000FE416D3
MYDDILVPTGGDQSIETVLEHTLAVAEGRDATAHVLYVIDDQAFLTLDEAMKADVLEDLRAEGQEAIQAATDLLEAAGVTVETRISQGKPAEEILSYVTEHDIDLVTMGTRADEFTTNMLGSTAQRVVTDSPVPVMTIHVS